MIEILLFSLAATIVLECSFAWVLGISHKKDLLLLALASVMTNPAVVWLYYFLYGVINPVFLVLLLESLAMIAEGWILQCYSETIRHPWKVAVLVNLFSYLIGLIFQ